MILAPIRLIRIGTVYTNRKTIICQPFLVSFVEKNFFLLALRKNVRYNGDGDVMKQLEEIKGLGPKKRNTLQKLGILTSEDLICYYPFRYELLKKSDILHLQQGDKIIMDGVIESVPNVFHINKRLDKMNFRLKSEKNLFQVVIFNRAFLKQKLVVGMEITVIGKYDLKHNLIIANDITLSPLPKTPKIIPVYHSYGGISGKQIQSYLEQIFSEEINVVDYIPKGISEKYQFMDKNRSLEQIHFPTSMNLLKAARLRAKYEELFLFMLKMNYLKNEKKHINGLKRNISYHEVEKFIEKLPFVLTDDQLFSIKEIYQDMNDQKRMNRLLQGDVGSGKTIVSFVAMYMNHLSGYQSALMVPTEILAYQHYKKLVDLLKSYHVHVAILTGNTKQKEKKEIYDGIKNGSISMIVGTHALISEALEYQNLGLVITDEQHRFGVNQRSLLRNKGIMPDILYMSATPIPRTYALTIYGDMDVSNIHTMPSGRLPIITTLKGSGEIRSVLESMYRELKNGHQVYVIAPLIEESEKVDLENVNVLEEKMKKAFGKLYQIGVLHGKMLPKEKEFVMNQFEQNEIQILISTTVVEVGVDVANATMIVIFDSERFGLSALHQLRGRVGRSNHQSYCILISDSAKERLSILTKTNDGFQISEEDFKLRGGGDLFGIRQSGDMRFLMADLKKDFSILMRAKEDSESYLLKGYLNTNTILQDYLTITEPLS